MQQLAQYLRSLRPSGKPSLREIARRSGLSHAFLALLEDGRYQNLEGETFQKVAKGYGVSIDKLLAVAGLTGEKPLPELDVYLRTKFGLGEDGIKEAEAFLGFVRQRYGRTRTRRRS